MFEDINTNTPPLPDGSGIQAAFAHNAALGQQKQAMEAQRPPHGIGNFLGRIGDALLVASGKSPIYGPAMEQRQQQMRQQHIGAALANYLGNTDSALADIMREDPSSGLEIYKMTHEKPNKPAGVEEYEYAKQNGFAGSYMDFLNAKGGPADREQRRRHVHDHSAWSGAGSHSRVPQLHHRLHWNISRLTRKLRATLTKNTALVRQSFRQRRCDGFNSVAHLLTA
jgi:hypothetical protein